MADEQIPYYRGKVTRAVRGKSLALSIEALWENVSPEPNSGCWLWCGKITTNGYGRLRRGGRDTPAHRVAYELIHGSVPVGLELDHLCRVRCCINPAHLEPVNRAENTRRGVSWFRMAETHRAKTHCPSGHPYAGENLYVSSDGKRSCKTCKQLSYRRNNPHPGGSR
jgi:hypothetical protein